MGEGVNLVTEVGCRVADCVYHREGDRCGAERIMVEIEKSRGKSYDAEFARDEDVSVRDRDEAGTSEATCCRTYRPKTEDGEFEEAGCR